LKGIHSEVIERFMKSSNSSFAGLLGRCSMEFLFLDGRPVSILSYPWNTGSDVEPWCCHSMLTWPIKESIFSYPYSKSRNLALTTSSFEIYNRSVISMLKGSMRWKGCLILDYYSMGDSQPYMLAVRLPAFYVRRLLSLSTSKPKIVSCRRMTAVPCLGSQHSTLIKLQNPRSHVLPILLVKAFVR
jgi:hypothetical protein